MVNKDALRRIFKREGIYADIGIDTDDNDIIIFDSCSDYNKVRWIEKLYNQLPYGYSDEYVPCSNCGRYIFTTPGYCEDIPPYEIFNDDILCGDCIRLSQYEDDYIEYLTNNQKAALKTSIIFPERMEEMGWKRLGESWKNGLHPNMNDKPEEVFAALQKKYPNNDIIFDYSPSQFYIEFGAWIKPSQGN